MLRRDYNNTDHTATQINNAVQQIVKTEKADYKIDGYNPDSIKLLCRTGYNWSIITEIMWDRADAQHLDILVESRSSDNKPVTGQIQHDNEEKHLNKICELLFKYIK